MNIQNKVSVIIPVYNAEKYLTSCIESILEQTYHNYEVIIINDGSTDNSADIINFYKKKYPSIFKIKHRENKGIVATLNELLDMVTGEYIARMDADDIAAPERLRMQVELMDSERDIVCCGTYIYIFKSDININRLIRLPKENKACKTWLLLGSCFAHPTVMMRANIIKENNLYYSSNFEYAEDYEFWSRISSYGKLCNINKPLLYYRSHQNQISTTKINIQKRMHSSIAVSNLAKSGIKIKKDILNIFLFPERTLGLLKVIYCSTYVYFKILKKTWCEIRFVNVIFLNKIAYYCKLKLKR